MEQPYQKNAPITKLNTSIRIVHEPSGAAKLILRIACPSRAIAEDLAATIRKQLDMDS